MAITEGNITLSEREQYNKYILFLKRELSKNFDILRNEFGNKCHYPDCNNNSNNSKLQFAFKHDKNIERIKYIIPRGKSEKYNNRLARYNKIKDNLDNYILLCREHHLLFDKCENELYVYSYQDLVSGSV